jgi:acetate kinase
MSGTGAVDRLDGTVLVFNAGSSTLKAEVQRLQSGTCVPLARAAVECAAGDFSTGTAAVVAELVSQLGGAAALMSAINAVGHRVVNGGTRLKATTRIDDAVIAAIEQLAPLAPLHNPAALAVIQASVRLLPATLPAYAVFDTAFFAALPESVVRYPLPRALTERCGVQRLGFHGLAHRALLDGLAAKLPCDSNTRVISLQLGQGCSVTASRGGQPVNTSMGFTPLGGLLMGTRPGDLDPGALLYLLRVSGLSPVELEQELNLHSGLLALSGVSGDMRELLRAAATGHADARLAITAFCRSARHAIGGFIAELAGAEAIVFGGGIGEHAPAIRVEICSGLETLGIELDAAANQQATGAASCISAHSSPIAVWVIATDEAAVIAREVLCAARG